MKPSRKSKPESRPAPEPIKITELGKVVARRKLHVRGAPERKAIVSIGAPRPFGRYPGYYCPFQITGVGHEQLRWAPGEDDVQAMESVMSMIGIEILVLQREFGVELRWEGAPDDPRCGFPAAHR